MAALTAPTRVSLSTLNPPNTCQMAGLIAGEALNEGSLCYIKSDGNVWMSDGSAADAEAGVIGITLDAVSVGEAVTLWFDVDIIYQTASTLTVGAKLYLSATEGVLDTAATTGGTAHIAYVKDATNKIVRLYQSRY